MPPRRRAAARSSSRRNYSADLPQSDIEQEVVDPQDGATPQEEQENEEDVAGSADDATSPAAASQDAASPAMSAASPPSSLPAASRGRGRGRARRGRPPTRKLDQLGPSDGGEEGADSPVKKRRGGFRGGFRGRPRRGGQGSAYYQRQPVDKDGNILEVVDDEIVFEPDPDGEDKVDKSGELLDGREYRVRTFTVTGREGRLYMLSTEPARCTGYRDSYLFFTRHPQLYKIILDEDEKRDLIEREVLPNSYKGRAIGVVTARSVFREFGARIVVGGKKVIDDYKVQQAKERGDIIGELADPDDKLPADGQPYNRNQYVAWHGASSVYHQNPPATQGVGGIPVASKKRPRITGANWMLEHARSASYYNSELSALRRRNQYGVFDPHTNLMAFPQNLQPTHVKWESVPDDEDEVAARSSKRQRLTNGDSGAPQDRPSSSASGSFDKPSAMVNRNWLVVDTHYVCAPHASLPRPGKRFGDIDQVMGTGSDHRCLPELTEQDLEMFGAETRKAFLHAKAVEGTWMDLWKGQGADGGRGALKIGVGTL